MLNVRQLLLHATGETNPRCNSPYPPSTIWEGTETEAVTWV